LAEMMPPTITPTAAPNGMAIWKMPSARPRFSLEYEALIMAAPPGTKPASPRPTKARGMSTPIKLVARPVTKVNPLQSMAIRPIDFLRLQRSIMWAIGKEKSAMPRMSTVEASPHSASVRPSSIFMGCRITENTCLSM